MFFKKTIWKDVESGNMEAVKHLVENGSEVNTKNDKGNIPLNIAIEKGHLEIAKYLVEKGAGVNTKDSEDWTALHWATLKGHLDMVKYLTKNGADINAKGKGLIKRGYTPLQIAVELLHLETVKYLVEKGAEVNIKCDAGKTPLHLAAEVPNSKELRDYFKDPDYVLAFKELKLDIVKCLVEKGAEVNAKGAGDRTALHNAASWGHLDMVKYLVESGADINAKREKNFTHGWTPLHDAVDKEHLEVVKCLVREGADINSETDSYWTALRLASQSGYTEIIKFLLESKAEVNTLRGWSPLREAARHGHIRSVELLLSYGAKDFIHSDNWSALKEAMHHKHTAIANMILHGVPTVHNQPQLQVSRNNPPQIKGANGNQIATDTELHEMVKAGNLEVVKYLLSKGVNCNTRDAEGKLPLQLARESTHEKRSSIIVALTKAGAEE